jgi:hypothetical protein
LPESAAVIKTSNNRPETRQTKWAVYHVSSD